LGHHNYTGSHLHGWVHLGSGAFIAAMMKKNMALTIFISIIGAGFVGGVLWATTKVVYRDRKIENEIETLKQQEGQIKSENQTLKDNIAFQQTPQAQELYAKQKLNLQKQDENVAVIKPGMTATAGGSSQASQDVPRVQMQPNYKKWWSYFFAYNKQ